MNIKVLDSSFELLAEVDHYDSISWMRRWHKPGETVLSIRANSKHAGKLLRGNILLYGDQAALITGTTRSVAENKETLSVKAQACAALCSRRIIMPPQGSEYDSQDHAAETVMKHFAANTFSGVSGFTVAADLGRGIQTSWNARFDNLAEMLEQISLNTGLGWGVEADRANSRFLFQVYEGTDRTNGSENPVIFRPDFGNVQTQSYAENEESFRNVAIVAGQGEGVDRTIQVVGDTTGLDRREVFIDARDIADTGLLIVRGAQQLANYPLQKNFECEVMDTPQRKYRTDWDLGDLVTVMNAGWGVSMDARIVEVREDVNASGTRITATFGTGMIRLSDAVKRVVSQSERALRVSAGSGSSSNEVKAQYSTDGSTGWTATYNSWHKYIRFSYDGGASWGSAIKFEGPQGIQGIQGNTGSQGVSCRNKGVWNNATQYVNDTQYIDIVNKDGSSYLCKTTHTNQAPPNATYWDLIASKGDTGSGGAADTLDGFHAASQPGDRFGQIPVIGTDGVMEVGKYLDFHEEDGCNADFDGRMYSSTGIPCWQHPSVGAWVMWFGYNLQIRTGQCTLGTSGWTGVSFSSPLSGTPIVCISPNTATNGAISPKVKDVTANGFSATIGGSGFSNIVCNYIAILLS